ncbi:Uncharacterized protein GBIM_17465 [Gryllus bimaculatus]|nr:Uncharacterized protein GBIM_17465 [Gryllus bimaculatus]
MDDMNLDEIAEQELLNEAKRGAARASVYGALGWQKCPLKPTNKVFLQNILLSTLSAKRRRDADSDSVMDSPKRRLLEADFREANSLRNRIEIDKKTIPDERQTLVNFRDNETQSKSSRKSDEKSSGQKYSRSSSSTVEVHPFRKRRKEHSRRRSSSRSSSSKPLVSSKHHKDSKKLSPKKHRH